MTIQRQILAPLVVLSTLIFSGVMLTPAHALAATCSGNGCNGTDPASTGCNQNAYLAKRLPILDMQYGLAIWQTYADVYYSNTCGTNWVRVTQNPYGGGTYKYIESLNPNGSTKYLETETDYGYGSSYSMQVYAPGSTKIRVYAKLFNTSGGAEAWTGVQTIQ